MTWADDHEQDIGTPIGDLAGKLLAKARAANPDAAAAEVEHGERCDCHECIAERRLLEEEDRAAPAEEFKAADYPTAAPPAPETEAERERKRVEDELARKLERAVNVIGVPFRHAQRLLRGEVQASESLAKTEQWRSRAVHGGILVLSGQVGCGKTFAATKFVLDGPPRAYPFGDKGWPSNSTPRFITARELQTLGLFGEADRAIELVRASVLAIDDLGVEFADEKGAFQATLDGLLDRRYGGVGFTIITTNMPLMDVVNDKTKKVTARGFGSRFGRRLLSRLQDDGCGFVHLREPSFRDAKNRKDRQ